MKSSFGGMCCHFANKYSAPRSKSPANDPGSYYRIRERIDTISAGTKSKKLRDFNLHRQEKFLYTLGAMDQWKWELRLINLEDGSAGDETPVC